MNIKSKKRLIEHELFHTKKFHQLCFNSRDQILATFIKKHCPDCTAWRFLIKQSKIDVKIADKIFDLIKIDYNDIYFSTENLYVMNWSTEFFWIFEKNENIASINALYFWLKSMQISSLWLIESNFSILLFLMNL